MTREEAILILENISALYSKFELSERKAELLLPILEQMDYNGVIKKLTAYAAKEPFPPTIDAISCYLPETNLNLKQMHIWKKEAAQVSTEVKRAFYSQFQQLIEGKAANDND
jgi:hypothetical protein